MCAHSLFVSPAPTPYLLFIPPSRPFILILRYNYTGPRKALILLCGSVWLLFSCFYLPSARIIGRYITPVFCMLLSEGCYSSFLTIHIIFIFYYCCVLYYGYFKIMNSSPLLCNLQLSVHLHLFVFLFVDCLLPPEDFTYLFIAFCCLCFEGTWLRPMWKNIFSIWDMYSGLSTYLKWLIKSKTRNMYMGKEGI